MLNFLIDRFWENITKKIICFGDTNIRYKIDLKKTEYILVPACHKLIKYFTDIDFLNTKGMVRLK